MKNLSYHFVNIEDQLIYQDDLDDTGSENHEEDALRLIGVEQDPRYQTGQIVKDPVDALSNQKYYKLNQIVFAEPVEYAQINEQETGTQEDVGEIMFIDTVMVKKRVGKRNKYFIDIKEGCLDCPLSNCAQTFATKTLLKAHIRKVHCATTKYVCEECGSGFTAAYLLRRHSAVHSGRKVQCRICGKMLSQRTDLSAHMRTHTAAREHACACGRRFLRRSALRRHEATHRKHLASPPHSPN